MQMSKPANAYLTCFLLLPPCAILSPWTQTPIRDVPLEILRRIDERTRQIQLDVEELKSMVNIQRNDIINLKRENDHFYQLFSRLTDRLERIENRLSLRDETS